MKNFLRYSLFKYALFCFFIFQIFLTVKLQQGFQKKFRKRQTSGPQVVARGLEVRRAVDCKHRVNFYDGQPNSLDSVNPAQLTQYAMSPCRFNKNGKKKVRIESGYVLIHKSHKEYAAYVNKKEHKPQLINDFVLMGPF